MTLDALGDLMGKLAAAQRALRLRTNSPQFSRTGAMRLVIRAKLWTLENLFDVPDLRVIMGIDVERDDSIPQGQLWLYDEVSGAHEVIRV